MAPNQPREADGKTPRSQRFATCRERGNADDKLAIEVLIPDGFRLDCIPHRIDEIPARPMDAVSVGGASP